MIVEIADTTLASNLDEKKQLYLTLEIPEYWVVDVRGKQIFAFRLINGKYQQCTKSIALLGLPLAQPLPRRIDLLEQTIAKMDNVNGNAAVWFAAQLENIPKSEV